MMKTSAKGLALIKKYEGFKSKPYLDPVGIPTIGYGVIKYPNGKRVTMNDASMTEKQASDMLAQLLEQTYEKDVNRLVKVALNQNQFDALVSFTYNLGGTNLSTSTLLRKVNANPNDPTIRAEFPRWNKAGGLVLAGLTRRRNEEAELYFTPIGANGSVISKLTTTDVNMRTGGSTQHSIIRVLKRGEEVNVLDTQGDWSEVFICATKEKGWVNNQFIS